MAMLSQRLEALTLADIKKAEMVVSLAIADGLSIAELDAAMLAHIAYSDNREQKLREAAAKNKALTCPSCGAKTWRNPESGNRERAMRAAIIDGITVVVCRSCRWSKMLEGV